LELGVSLSGVVLGKTLGPLTFDLLGDVTRGSPKIPHTPLIPRYQQLTTVYLLGVVGQISLRDYL
jgi:hypothetical protein